MSSLKPLLKELGNEKLPFLCLEYKGTNGVEHSIVVVYLAEVDSLDGLKIKNLVSIGASLISTKVVYLATTSCVTLGVT